MTIKRALSVVIPVCNTEEFLPRSMKSVLGQTLRDLELIIVNDGSSGPCEAVVKPFADADKRVRYLACEKNEGTFKARIAGSRLAMGDFIAFMDSGDEITRDYYRVLIDKAEKSGADIVAGKTMSVWDERAYILTIMDNMFFHRDLLGEEILSRLCTCRGMIYLWHTLCTKLYRKSLWDRCLPWFGRFARHCIMVEDLACSVPLMHHARKMTFVESEYYLYRHHFKSVTQKPRLSIEELLKHISDTAAVFDFIGAFLDEIGASDENKKNISEFRNMYYQQNREKAASVGPKNLSPDERMRLEEALQALSPNINEESGPRNAWFFFQLETNYPKPAIQTLKELIASPDFDCISFDLFDTLIVRPFFSPVDLFLLLEKKYESLVKSIVPFHDMRVEAEKGARESLSHDASEEISLEAIYDQISAVYGIPATVLAQLAEEERRLEIRLSRPRKTAKELFGLAKATGKRIVITSDIYLDESTIRAILTKNGYDGYSRLFVSSTYGVTKRSGNFFPRILDELGIPAKRILHIGDDWTCDYVNPRRYGIRPFFFPKTIDALCNNVKTHPTNDCYNIARKSYGVIGHPRGLEGSPGYRTALALVANRYFDNPYRPFHPESDFNADPFLIGYYPLAMHLLGLTKWILERCRKQNYRRIHFVSRDGYLPKLFFDKLALYYRDAPKTDYVHGSRHALLPAILDDDLDFLGPMFRQAERANKNPAYILQLFSFCLKQIRKAELKEKLARNGFCLERPFGSINEYRKFILFFRAELYDGDRHAESRRVTADYYRDKVGAADVFFDAGYSGANAAAISKLTGGNANFLYIHSAFDAAEDMQRRHDFELDCFYDFYPAITGPLREYFISEIGPSCAGFKRVDGAIEPILEASGDNVPKTLVVEKIQSAALEFLDDYLATFSGYLDYLPFKSHEMSMPFEGFLRLHRDADRKIFTGSLFDDFTGGSTERIDLYNVARSDTMWCNQMHRANRVMPDSFAGAD